MLNPISTITVESALIPAASEPETAPTDLFQTLIAELLETTAAPAPDSSSPKTPNHHQPTASPSETPLLKQEGWLRHKEMLPFLAGADGVVSPGPSRVSDHPTARDQKQSLAVSPPVPGGEPREPETVPGPPAHFASEDVPVRPVAAGFMPASFELGNIPIERDPEIQPTPSEREAPPETKSVPLPPTFVLMPSIPEIVLNRAEVPVDSGAQPRSVAELQIAPDFPVPEVRKIVVPTLEPISIRIEPAALPGPLVKSEPVIVRSPSQPVVKRPVLEIPTDVAKSTTLPDVTPRVPQKLEMPVADSQVNTTTPDVQPAQTPQTPQTPDTPQSAQPLRPVEARVQPEVVTTQQPVQSQPVVMPAETATKVAPVATGSPHFAQSGSQERQESGNESRRATPHETVSAAPHLATPLRFESHLMPLESRTPAAHVVEIPPQLPPPVAHRVLIDIGEKDSRVVVTLHENQGDVSVKIHAPNEVLGAELRSSAGTLVEAFHREHISLANMDFTSGYTATSDDGRQHRSQPRQSFQNRARKFQLAAAPTDQVEITSINLNA